MTIPIIPATKFSPATPYFIAICFETKNFNLIWLMFMTIPTFIATRPTLFYQKIFEWTYV